MKFYKVMTPSGQESSQWEFEVKHGNSIESNLQKSFKKSKAEIHHINIRACSGSVNSVLFKSSLLG